MSFALSFIVSLHDALPIWRGRAGPEPDAPAHHRALRGARAGVRGPRGGGRGRRGGPGRLLCAAAGGAGGDRKSTRLNSSHVAISYAVLCLKKKIYSYLLDS